MAACPHGYIAVPGFVLPHPSVLPSNFFDVADIVLRRPLHNVEDPDLVADLLLFCMYGSQDHWPRKFDTWPSLDICEILCDWSYERNERDVEEDEKEAMMEYMMEEMMSRMGLERVLPRGQERTRRDTAGSQPKACGEYKGPRLLKGVGGKTGGSSSERAPPRAGGRSGTAPPRAGDTNTDTAPSRGLEKASEAGAGPTKGGSHTNTASPQGGQKVDTGRPRAGGQTRPTRTQGGTTDAPSEGPSGKTAKAAPNTALKAHNPCPNCGATHSWL